MSFSNFSDYNDSMNDRTPIIEPDPVIEAYKKDVDRTLLRENLRLTVEERFNNLRALQRFADELQKSNRRRAGLGD